MRFWGNLIGYQLVWFIAVICASVGMAWPGVGAAVLFALWQLAISRQRRLDLKLAGTALLMGMLIDGGLSLMGWLRYATPAPAVPTGGAPVWILGLWLAFSLTLGESLKFLQGRYLLAAAFGAIGAPLAYLGAARGWHAVTFAVPAWYALTGLAIGWGIAMLLLVTLLPRRAAKTSVELVVLPWKAS